MKMKLAALALLSLALVACKPDCKQLAALLDAAQASGDPTLIATAQKAFDDAKCTVPVPTPAPPALCSDGLPPLDGECPATCGDLACKYGCDDRVRPNICKPKPEVPPPTTCEPACKATEQCVKRDTYECVPVTPTEEAPLIRDEDLTGIGDAQPAQMWDETDAAIKRWQALHPEKWMDRGGSRCLLAGPAEIDEAFLGISTELLRVQIVAGQSINVYDQRSDCIFVNRPGSKLYEEAHIFDYARACVATGPNAMRGLYRRGDAPPAEPPPAEPISTTCPFEPCPLKLWTAETLPPGWGADAIGTPAWEWKAKLHTMGNGDSTPVVVRQEPFCYAIGLSPNRNRASCPVRSDGHAERVPVENWLLDGGAVRDGRNGQDCTPNNTDNPLAFLWGTGDCRICNTPKTVCSEWH